MAKCDYKFAPRFKEVDKFSESPVSISRGNMHPNCTEKNQIKFSV